jgi:hypothetical protein
MNTPQTQGLDIWTFVAITLRLFAITMSLAMFRVSRITTKDEMEDATNDPTNQELARRFPNSMLKWLSSFRISPISEQRVSVKHKYGLRSEVCTEFQEHRRQECLRP